MKSSLPFIMFALCCLIIGLYPSIHFLIDDFGLLQTKQETVLSNTVWKFNFYMHITFGGLALLIGWSQFVKQWRVKYPTYHRLIGYSYIISVFISGVSGFYIALYATGGLMSTLGFASLSLLWLLSTFFAFKHVKRGAIHKHEIYMIYSFSACFAAVTLRIWLPLLVLVIGEFLMAYKIVAWLCWVPNIVVAYFIVKQKKAADV